MLCDGGKTARNEAGQVRPDHQGFHLLCGASGSHPGGKGRGGGKGVGKDLKLGVGFQVGWGDRVIFVC